jgi:DNA adenine methylase
MPMKSAPTEPFLKWAGGKRWLVRQYSVLFPRTFGRYIEPFVGSGAVFFHLQPKSATLADKNAALIEAYETVRDDTSSVEALLQEYQTLHCSGFYYDVRRSAPATSIERTARFIYLNRVCWNGLYRVNLKGEFNVPLGTKRQVAFLLGSWIRLLPICGRPGCGFQISKP